MQNTCSRHSINKNKGTPIIGHGDVKRQLLIMRSLTEAMRALILFQLK